MECWLLQGFSPLQTHPLFWHPLSVAGKEKMVWNYSSIVDKRMPFCSLKNSSYCTGVYIFGPTEKASLVPEVSNSGPLCCTCQEDSRKSGLGCQAVKLQCVFPDPILPNSFGSWRCLPRSWIWTCGLKGAWWVVVAPFLQDQVLAEERREISSTADETLPIVRLAKTCPRLEVFTALNDLCDITYERPSFYVHILNKWKSYRI